MKVMVTGGAGYIGSHVVLELLARGHEVVVVDNLSTGHRELVPNEADLVVVDVGEGRRIREVLDRSGAEAVMHFAGSIVVPESVENPLLYYQNNTAKSRELMAACVDQGVKRFVFSSTAAVYGEPAISPVSETMTAQPVNPYGRSKLMTEWMLEDLARAEEGFEYVALRYFNVAGADGAGRSGQVVKDATHLIKVAVQTALGMREKLTIFGNDYPTHDGTCVRDYIHVSDLAAIHVEALEYLRAGGKSVALNCGYGRGFSVREVVEMVKKVSGVDFVVEEGERRPGDPAQLVADPRRVREVFGWAPKHQDLEEIVATALAWEERVGGEALTPG